MSDAGKKVTAVRFLVSGYRSIAHIILNADNITALIGRNGSGKSNILSALNYFYRNLTGIYDEANIFDATNSLRNEICISVTYDMERIMRIIQNLASPGSRNYQVPALSVADMDKVLKKVQGKNRFIVEDIRRDGQKDREPYWYGRKRADTLIVKRRILGMCGKCNFTYQYPFYSCDDNNFRCLLALIKKYYENYDIFLWDTTIEGALITGRNSEQFLHFMIQYLEKQRVSSAVRSKIGLYCQKYENRPNIRLNYLRMIFSGKCDYLLTKRQLQNENEKIYPDLLDTMMIIRKTENWISCWLEKEDNYRHVVSEFGIDFDELYSFLSRIKMTLSEKDGRLNVSRQ